MEEINNTSSQVHERVGNIKDEDENEPMQLSELASSTTSLIIGTESKVNKSETLGVADLQSAFITPSHDLCEEVAVEYTLLQHDVADLKGQATESQQALVSVISPTDEANNYLQFPGCQTSSDEISPTVAQSISSGPSQTLQEQIVSPLANCSSRCVAEVTEKNSFNSNSGSATPIVKASSTDGYNWRKYGQKQVKSPQGSRSYYKCTYSDCYAKKIECSSSSSRSGIEITYKNHHNHDPPQKVKCAREKRLALSVAPIVGSSSSNPVKILRSNGVATSPEESIDKKFPVTGTEQQNSSGSGGNAKMNDMDQHLDKPEPKQRVKKSSLVSDDPVCTPGKKPKFVVHATGDVGISGDGYRWRKYGQKVVKGTPHPRNYYRCTSAGCPVKKHTEMATKSTDALIITYKGIHDHDMPVPKKRHGAPSAPLLVASAPASMNNLNFQTPEALQNEKSATKWSVDMEGELTGQTLEPGGQKTTNSARTLLSIDFEIKPC